MIKEIYINLLQNYACKPGQLSELWQEVEDNYTQTNRYYHSLKHIENLLKELFEIKDLIVDWNTVLFSLYYHDIVYSSWKSDNEEKSAELAMKRMIEIGVNDNQIEKCKHQIIATKSHKISANSDTNYFTDADLAILGTDWSTYKTYSENVRKEYAIYPNIIYKRGRKKVINHFLAMDKIFKTDEFIHKYESQARENLINEMNLL